MTGRAFLPMTRHQQRLFKRATGCIQYICIVHLEWLVNKTELDNNG